MESAARVPRRNAALRARSRCSYIINRDRLMSTPLNEPSDEELLRRYHETDNDDGGEAFITIYTRYRDLVRAELEGAGLEPRAAEERMGSVFIRAMDPHGAPGGNQAFRERLLETARTVARDPNWTPF